MFTDPCSAELPGRDHRPALARLTAFRNVLVTSHQAYFTQDAQDQIVAATVANVQDYPAGRTGTNTLAAPGFLPQQ